MAIRLLLVSLEVYLPAELTAIVVSYHFTQEVAEKAAAINDKETLRLALNKGWSFCISAAMNVAKAHRAAGAAHMLRDALVRCRYCEKSFYSRNALFRHLQDLPSHNGEIGMKRLQANKPHYVLRFLAAFCS